MLRSFYYWNVVLFSFLCFLSLASNAQSIVCDYQVTSCNYTSGVGVKCNSYSPVDGAVSLLVQSTPTTNYADICMQPANATGNWQNSSGILTTYQYNGATAGAVCTQAQIDNGLRRYRPWTATARKLTTGECPPPPSCAITHQWESRDNQVVCVKYAPSNGPTCNNDPGSIVSDSSCTPPKPVIEPPHCSDGEKSGNESGVDCEGSCSAACEHATKCPVGYMTISQNGGEPYCRKYYTADAAGNCLGSDYYDDFFKQCRSDIDATRVYGAAGYVADWYDNPATTPDAPDKDWKQGTFSQTEFVTPKVITNNPDGTSTVETTKTVITNNIDGSTKTSTSTSTVIYSGANGTGDVIGESVTSGGTAGPEDSPENYDFSAPDGEAVDFGDEAIRGKLATVYSNFTSRMQTAPIRAALDGVMSGPPEERAYSVSTISMGSHGVVEIDWSNYSGALNVLGWFIVGVSGIRAARLIIANK